MASVPSKDKKSARQRPTALPGRWPRPGGSEKKEGEMNAVSANAVGFNMRRIGMMPIMVRKVPQPLLWEKGVKEAQLIDRFSLKIPMLGVILFKGAAVARFMRTLSTMQAAGVCLSWKRWIPLSNVFIFFVFMLLSRCLP